MSFAGKHGLIPQLQQLVSAQRALAPPPRRTAKDAAGRLRYLDSGEFAFPDMADYAKPGKDGGFTLGEGDIRFDAAGNVVARGADKPPATPDFKDAMRLADSWQKVSGTARDLIRQRDLMRIGLERAEKGDMAAGSQAVLVTFQKILDPTSVVRESEYARSASGLSLLEQAAGAFERLKKGGAGLTVDQLRSFYRLADDAVNKLTGGYVRGERDRIGRFADRYNIPRDVIFSGRLGAAPPAAPPPAAPPAAPPQPAAAPAPVNPEAAARALEAGAMTLDQLPRELWGQVRAILQRNAAMAGRG